MFASYSRKDAEFVQRLVARLESERHDVWVDTEDIRGSEAWRASIIDAIRQADAVLLVISPNSMASAHVQREITVAAEERRRIVPVVLRPAELTGGIRYELAGIQQVSFVARDFDDAAGELLHELSGFEAGESASPPETTVRPTRNPLRSRPVVIGAALVGLLGLFLVFRDDDNQDDAAGAADVAVADPGLPPSEASASAAVETVTLDSEVWFAGFAINTEAAQYDPQEQAVAVTTTFTNEQPAPADPRNLLLDETTALEWSGRRSSGFICECDRLAQGATGRMLFTFDVDQGFDFDDAALVFGGPRQHQARVPLDGGLADGPEPVVQSVNGAVDDGAGTTFTVDRVEVLPAACSGLSTSLTYEPAPADEFSVVVWGTAVTTDPAPGGVGFGEAYLVLPDGTKAGSSSLDGYIYVLSADQPQRNIPVCITVVGPVSGEYRFVATAVGVEPVPPGVMLRF